MTQDRNIQLKIKEILPSLTSIILSKPTTNSTYIKAKISKKIDSKTNSPVLFLEQFTSTQSFHSILDNKQALEFLINNIAINYKNANAFVIFSSTESATFTFLTNKKGKTTILTKKIEQNNESSTKNIQLKSSQSNCPLSLNSTQTINRTKKYLLPEGEPINFLVELGVMNAEGKVLAKQMDKFRQINRFLEFVDDILPSLNLTIKPLSIIDFGCGKSYLTFAIYYYLTVIKKQPVKILGIDLKADVIEECEQLALTCGYSGLEFHCGDIAEWEKTHTGSSVDNFEQPDLVISLHACDTATDYALSFAVEHSAKAILSVPCCQHELNTSLSSAEARSKLAPQFSALLKHGIIKERFCALATDVMRAELLEQAGYKVQILEFIDMEHTPKNLLIRAIKKQKKAPNLSSDFENLKKGLGASITLEKLL